MAGRIQNLKPWKPGQSGNPGGRPKRDLAAEIAGAIFEQNAEAIQQVFAKELRKSNYKVFAALADRAYGRPHQSLGLSTGEGGAESLYPGGLCEFEVRGRKRMSGRVENLKPWKPGQSGNLGGRPRTRSLTDELARLLEMEAPDSDGQSWAALIAEALLKKARKGDV